jgi:hypothetical protein
VKIAGCVNRRGGLGGFVVLLGGIAGECDRSKRSLSDLRNGIYRTTLWS